jgi:hypothetical protein
MDLNKFKSLSIDNGNKINSPLRRLINRNIYGSVSVTTSSTSKTTNVNQSTTVLTETTESMSSCELNNSFNNPFSISACSSSDASNNTSKSNINITYNISNDIDVENDENDQGESISNFTSDDEIDSDEIVFYNIESDDDSFETSDGLSTMEGVKKKLELIKTQRGKDKLAWLGYYYTWAGSNTVPPPIENVSVLGVKLAKV